MAVAGAIGGVALAGLKMGAKGIFALSKGITKGPTKGLLSGMNKIQGTYDPRFGERRGGIFGRHGLKERFDDFKKNGQLKKQFPGLSKIQRQKMIQDQKNAMPKRYNDKTGHFDKNTNPKNNSTAPKNNILPKNLNNDTTNKGGKDNE